MLYFMLHTSFVSTPVCNPSSCMVRDGSTALVLSFSTPQKSQALFVIYAFVFLMLKNLTPHLSIPHLTPKKSQKYQGTNVSGAGWT